MLFDRSEINILISLTLTFIIQELRFFFHFTVTAAGAKKSNVYSCCD